MKALPLAQTGLQNLCQKKECFSSFFLSIREIEGTNFRECWKTPWWKGPVSQLNFVRFFSDSTKLVVCTTVNFLTFLIVGLSKVIGMLKRNLFLSYSSFHYYRGSITKAALASNNSSPTAQVERKLVSLHMQSMRKWVLCEGWKQHARSAIGTIY